MNRPLHATTENPALAAFDISNYRGVRGRNFFDEDRLLQRIVKQHAAGLAPAHRDALVGHLQAYGELVGGVLDELTEKSHREDKYGYVVQYDRTGNRIDEVVYSPEQKEARRISYEHGIVNLDFHPEWKHDFTMTHRMALAYLANMNGEGGVTCPLAMTDGMIRVLKALGTQEQKQRYLPLVAGPGSASHFMCGQYVTERVGGSNVGQNRTVARSIGNDRWILTGEKWFCSNPGDLWVTTARIENTNTIGMFLVPRIKRDGTLNGCRILRKKDIIGSRGKITVEVVYDELEAETLGRPAHGLANLIKYVINTSRVHVSVAACGMSRRAFMEARAYVDVREAYGKKVIEFPTVKKALAEMQILHSSVVWNSFRTYTLADQGHAAASLLTPLLKLKSTLHSSWITHEAMMLHGGNGILGDFSCLPRLHNDSLINETWEGTHQIMSEHILKAFLRPKVRSAFFDLVEANLKQAKDVSNVTMEALGARRKFLDQSLNADHAWRDLNRMSICDAIYDVFSLSEWIAQTADGEPVMQDMARGYAELCSRGVQGPTWPDGVFQDEAALSRLIAY